MDRHARQRQLAGVGDAGQARIAAASFAIAGDASQATLVEREYLVRAGAQRFEPRAAALPFAHAAAFRHAESLSLAAGAWRALDQLRSVLELKIP
jgi:hypothetical protein